MTDEERISRNKKIFRAFVLVLVCCCVAHVLCNSEYTGQLQYTPATNGRTGEPVGLIGSFVYHAFLFFVATGLVGSVILVLSMFLFLIMHPGIEKHGRSYRSPYDSELDCAFKWSYEYTAIATALVMLLQISGIFDIQI